MRALVILDRQHGDKGARFDPGARFGGLQEVDLTTAYGTSCAAHLRAAGVDVLWLDSGGYQERHLEAADAADLVAPRPALYLALHVNAGRGRLGIGFYDARSPRGARASAAIARALGERLPELAGSRSIAARPSDWTVNAWHTIRRIYSAAGPNLSGVCVEPGFIDQPAHAGLWSPPGLERVGAAVAEGALAFLRAESGTAAAIGGK